MCDEADTTNFLFINVEENIKKENVEDEREIEKEENTEGAGGYVAHQDDSAENETENGDGDKSSTFGSEEMDVEGVCTAEGSNGSNLNAKDNNQTFSCDKCSMSYVSAVYLEGHRNRCRGNRTGDNTQAGETAVTQPLDVSITDTPLRKTKSRVPIGETNHKCETCGRGFVRLSNLRAHEATHTAEYKCDKCPYTTDLRKHLMRHMVVHYGREEKIYACPHCSYTAGKSTYFRNHVAKHTGDKRYKCDVCSYETVVFSNLTKHMEVHNGEKAFACSHCYYSTAKKAQLAKHLVKFHSSQAHDDT